MSVWLEIEMSFCHNWCQVTEMDGPPVHVDMRTSRRRPDDDDWMWTVDLVS